MKSRYIFHTDNYYNTLKNQIGQGIPVFHGGRQRGGGLGSVLGFISKYALPLIKKYIIPHIKNAAISSVHDVVGDGLSIKSSLKNRGKQFIKNVGISAANSIVSKQTGGGKRRSKKFFIKNFNFLNIFSNFYREKK